MIKYIGRFRFEERSMRTCDLHTHSIYSDGTCTPTELVLMAEGLGLSAVALCDHNTADGLDELLSAAEGKNVEAVAGVELSTDYNGTELHLLALFIPRDSFGKVEALTCEMNRRKDEANIDLALALVGGGFDIDYAEIKSKTPKGKVNRAHFAAELTCKGYTKSIDEAFATVLSPEAGYYKEPVRHSVFEMIDFVIDIGAVPVLAHPFLNLTEEELCAFLPIAKERGLCGMECLYSEYDEERTSRSFDIADRFGLAYSGGSDFHGENKPSIRLGVGKGNLKIPYEFVLELKKRVTE